MFFILSVGPDHDRSSLDATEFTIMGNVEVTLEEDSMLMVDTDALFRGDVTIACDEDDVDDFDDRRLLEEDENNAGDQDGLARGSKHRHLGHKSHSRHRKSCKDPPSLLAQQARIEKLKTDELSVYDDLEIVGKLTATTFEVANSDQLLGDGPTTLDLGGLSLGQGGIDTNGGDIATGAGDITSTGTIEGDTLTGDTITSGTADDLTTIAGGDVTVVNGGITTTIIGGTVDAETQVIANGGVLT
jgi:hypothetical protein